MSDDLFSSLDAFAVRSISSSDALLVREATGAYRLAVPQEVVAAAQRLLAARVRGSDVLRSPALVRDFLRLRLGHLAHEVFAVVHLDAHLAVLDYVEMFRGTVTQTSVYPREVIKDAMALNSTALLLVHCHPSGCGDPSRADEALTHMLKQALAMVDVQVLDHLIVAGHTVVSMVELGLV